jgi:hypothetical protein
MSEVVPFEVLLQRSTELEIARCKVWAEWWMRKMLPAVCGELLMGLRDVEGILQFIDHMATLSAYYCCSALQFLKEQSG